MKTLKVMPRGRIRFNGLIYANEVLVLYAGLEVVVMEDRSIGGADCICFDPDTGKFICNAHNRALWNVLIDGINETVDGPNTTEQARAGSASPGSAGSTSESRTT